MSLEKLRTFAVVDRLHVNAIVGTDALKAFHAVLELDENNVTLKESGETFPLGPPRIEEMYGSRIASTIRLRPGGQALVVCSVIGRAPEKATVLLEGLPELHPKLKVARTLCTVNEGQTLARICNASTEELVVKNGTALVAATVVPDAAFDARSPAMDSATAAVPSAEVPSASEDGWVHAVLATVAAEPRPSLESMPGLKNAYEAELQAGFANSKLAKEQQEQMCDLLGAFWDMFVKSSMKPGRTDLLEISIDTGTHSPIKSKPYRVSKAVGDVMENEIQQYLELNLIRPCPWASPVFMIRKPDGGIRFCIDYRRLDAVTVKNCYPMPLIDILDVLQGAKLFFPLEWISPPGIGTYPWLPTAWKERLLPASTVSLNGW